MNGSVVPARDGRRPIFLVDMDSTFVDWEKGFYAVTDEVAARMGVANPLPPGGLTSWVVTGGNSERDRVIDAAFAHPDLYEMLEPFPGSVEALGEMLEEGDTFLCTAPDHRNQNCVQGKLVTIDRYLDRDWMDRVIFTRDKTLFLGDILWDDHPNITGVMSAPTWQQILFDNQWNRHVELPRITNWSQWRTVAAEVLERSRNRA